MFEWTVPVIGGLALIVGSGLTIYVDRRERLRDETCPRPVMYRFFSQAILALHRWPHWIFVATCNVVGPCVHATAVWQAALVGSRCGSSGLPRDYDDDDNEYMYCSALARSLRRDGLLTAICLYLDAWIPLGRPAVTHASHAVVAVGFFAFGTHYVYATILMAKLLAAEHSDYANFDALVLGRATLFGIMIVAGAVIALTTSPAIDAHGRLLNHQFRGTAESRMDHEEIARCRRMEASMSTAQMVLGIGLGVTLFTAVGDVVDLMDSADEMSDVPTTGGLVMFYGMACLALLEYVFRDPIYLWCQAMLLRFRVPAQKREHPPTKTN